MPAKDVAVALLEAAVALAEEGGVGAIGLREAARRAGVTHGAPYRHYPNHEALIAAVAEDGFRRLWEVARLALASAGPNPLERFSALGRGYLHFARRHPGHFRVMFAAKEGRRSEAVKNAEAAVFALAVNEIAACQRVGLARSGDPQSLALVAWSGVHGLAQLWLDGLVDWLGLGEANAEAFVSRYTAEIFRGLSPSASPPRPRRPPGAPRQKRVEVRPRRR